jgi:hypothetical protein
LLERRRLTPQERTMLESLLEEKNP